jgi:hypothetical protein
MQCNGVWCYASVINGTQGTPKKALRVALGAAYNSHTDPLFAEIKSLKLTDLYDYTLAKIGSEVINKIAHPGVKDCYTVLQPDERLHDGLGGQERVEVLPVLLEIEPRRLRRPFRLLLHAPIGLQAQHVLASDILAQGSFVPQPRHQVVHVGA